MSKRKPPHNKKVHYFLKVTAWKINNSFGTGYYVPGLIEKDISVISNLLVHCELQTPKIKKINEAMIVFMETNVFDNFLNKENQPGDIERIGTVRKTRGENYLTFMIGLPPNFYRNIILTFGFNKANFISIAGDKLWYGRGNIYDVSIDTENEKSHSKL